MTEEKKIFRIPNIVVGMCQDCAFYNDCPIEYLCPAAEIIADAIIGFDRKKEDKE